MAPGECWRLPHPFPVIFLNTLHKTSIRGYSAKRLDITSRRTSVITRQRRTMSTLVKCLALALKGLWGGGGAGMQEHFQHKLGPYWRTCTTTRVGAWNVFIRFAKVYLSFWNGFSINKILLGSL